jgi:membrane associated rhomboid family serine protease
MMKITPVVKQLLIINIIFFAGSQLIQLRGSNAADDLLAMHYLSCDKFRIWQPITHMFMHGGIMHIAFNMFALYSFGSTLESFWGGKKFLFFYISCGLGAVALHTAINFYQMQNMLEGLASFNFSNETMHQILNATIFEGDQFRPDLFTNELNTILQGTDKINLINQTPDGINSIVEAAVNNQSAMLGASGAIYGLLVAFAFMIPNAELMMVFLPIPIKAKYFVPLILLGDLYLGVTGKSIFGGSSGIAHFAHIGGAVLGFIIMWYWKKNSFNDRRWN